ncbi:hypothetical protein BX666DRAFT_280347 [Dichotomocladium elegans]|nr:hypothetical protein BX666DRAFT_280347 [Dichotomocladium elegans]
MARTERMEVPFFGPPLQENAIFFDEKELRSFMLAKLINAEYAAYRSPKFAQPMARAREGILAHIAERGSKLTKELELTPPAPSFIKHSKSLSSSSDQSTKSDCSAGSDFISTPSRSSMIKESSDRMAASIGGRRSEQEQDIKEAFSSKAVRTPKHRKGKTGTMVAFSAVEGKL